MAEAETANDPEKTTPEDRAAAEEARQAAFRAAYAEEAPPVATQPTESAVDKDEPEPSGTVEPPAETPPASAGPKTVTLTEEDYKLLRAAAEKSPDLEQRISKVLGTVGAVQDQVKQLRSQKGRVRIGKEALAKLVEGFPEIADALVPALEAAEIDVSSVTPVATQPQAAAPVDAAKIKEELKAELREERTAERLKRLGKLVPGWQQIAGPHDADNEFRRWLKAQPEAYQKGLANEAATVEETADCFKAFLRHQAKAKAAQKSTPPARDAARTDRLRDAIPPRGAGAALIPTQPTRQDAFREGYRTG